MPENFLGLSPRGRLISRVSEPSIWAGFSDRRYSMLRSTRAISSANVVSLSSYAGVSTPARRAPVPRAKSVAIWICLVSGNMSGLKRALRKTDSSIFFAWACAAPLARMAFRLVSMRMNTGTDAWYMEMVMGFPFCGPAL